MSGREAERYARTIEGWWAGLRETPSVLSQRDWELICDWYARGVPLELVREALQSAGESKSSARRSGPPRSLAYFVPQVEEAWTVVCGGRLDAPAVAEPGEDRSLSAWRSCRRGEPRGSAVAALLDELLGRLQAGEAGPALDLDLDRRLPAAVPAGSLRAIEAGIVADLEPFRHRMSEQVYRTTYRRAVSERLRGRLRLPRLANDPGNS